MNGPGTLQVDLSLPLVDPYTGVTIDLPNELVPGRDFIGWVEGDTIIEAGPIQSDPFSWPYTSTIRARGLWQYFTRRFILPVLTSGKLPRDVTSTWSGLSLGTIAKRIVQQACSWPSAALPIVYEPDLAGIHERTYPGSDMTSVANALTNLTEVEGGPEITFRPRWGADRKHIVWDLLTGSPELAQAGADHYWDTAVIGAHAKPISLERDAADLTTHDYEFGDTPSGGAQLQARASSSALTSAGFPMMESLTRRNSVLLVQTLQSYAVESSARGADHLQAFTIQVARDRHPDLGSYWPGDWAKVVIGKNPRIPAGTYRMRVATVTFAHTGMVELDMIPERAASGYPAVTPRNARPAERLNILRAALDETQRGH